MPSSCRSISICHDRERGEQFQQQILDRVRALPGVLAAGVGNYVPPDLHVAILQVKIEGRPETRGGEAPLAGSASASPGYFQALGARLLAGRDFAEQDDERILRVAVVNETFARSYWPEQNAPDAAIGKRFSLPDRDNPDSGNRSCGGRQISQSQRSLAPFRLHSAQAILQRTYHGGGADFIR